MLKEVFMEASGLNDTVRVTALRFYIGRRSKKTQDLNLKIRLNESES